jgi:hypothetical protein
MGNPDGSGVFLEGGTGRCHLLERGWSTQANPRSWDAIPARGRIDRWWIGFVELGDDTTRMTRAFRRCRSAPGTWPSSLRIGCRLPRRWLPWSGLTMVRGKPRGSCAELAPPRIPPAMSAPCCCSFPAATSGTTPGWSEHCFPTPKARCCSRPVAGSVPKSRPCASATASPTSI